MVQLRRKNLDLKRGLLRLNPGTTKNDEGRAFPLNAELRQVFERALELATVRTYRTAGIPDRVEKRTLPNGKEITKVTCGRIFHDFRRTAVRNVKNAGVPRSLAMRLVGRKTEAIYNRYAISNENDLREAVRKLDAAQNAL